MDKVSTISDGIRILSTRIERELNRLHQDAHTEINRSDSLIYVGNWQDAIPRSIWLDQSLTATDVRCWGVIRTQAVQGCSVMLSLNQLLADTLGYSKATISRVIYVLRLTRWISLCSKLRSSGGQFRGYVYAIHDNPISLNDAMYLDENYLSFVKKQINHSSEQIGQLAKTIWQTINNTVQTNPTYFHDHSESGALGFINTMTNQIRPTGFCQVQKLNLVENDQVQKLNLANDQVQKLNLANDQVQKLNLVENDQVQKLNLAENDQVQKLNLVEKNSENYENQELNNQVQKLNLVENDQVQKLNLANVCSSSYININNKTTTTTTCSSQKQNFENCDETENLPDEENTLIFPTDFNRNERQLAAMYLDNIETELRQSFLDETAGQIIQRRKTAKPIRNPIGFLSWLCTEHASGKTYLTSVHIKHREQRERQEATEKTIKAMQDALTAAARQSNDRAKRDVEGRKEKHAAHVQELKASIRGG